MNRHEQAKLYEETGDEYWNPGFNDDDAAVLADYFCENANQFYDEVFAIFAEGYSGDAGLLVRDLINKVERGLINDRSV
ncbi:MAG: hypothetical protein DBP02_01960 [gamma proteobacterium symbiont of Ctena orbiculata]|nr:MAG: hypothetical protein DBP02_01960 [gamma proteobacterium symbiont of Ctena orbiculata]